jgi:hypothetical protein
MKKALLAVLTAIALLPLSAPAVSVEPEFVKVSSFLDGFSPTSNASRGGPGSRVGTTSDGQTVFFSDFSLFNNYSWDRSFQNNAGTLVGPKLYLSTDGGVTTSALNSAPMADWGPVAISSDAQTLVAIHKSAYISSNTKISGPGLWLSVDGGASFAKQTLRAGAGTTWDVALSSNSNLIIATEDARGYKPYVKTPASASWSELNVANGAWRNVSMSQNAAVVALCEQDSGIYISRDLGANFALEIPSLAGEGCGPMELSGDGNTLVIGRFAHPNKKVFRYQGSAWILVNTLVGVNAWGSTGSVSVSNDGQIITIGDYLSSPARISLSKDGGVSFTNISNTVSFVSSTEAFITPDGSRIFSFNSDGLYRLDVTPLQNAEPANPPEPTPYSGPVVTASRLNVDAGEDVVIGGSGMSGVTAAEVQGSDAKVLSVSDQELRLRLPDDLEPGPTDLTLKGSFGVLTIQDALLIKTNSSVALTKSAWTKNNLDGTVKLIFKDPVNKGKIQFFANGQELIWVKASDSSDPKLLNATSTPYLVHAFRLQPGKNRLETKVDGERAWRATYVPLG